MKFQRHVLQNGVRLLTVPMKDTSTVTVLVLVETGSKYETKNLAGVSHFLEHMCFKGTEKRPNAHVLSTELDSIGAEYNAFTSQEYTGYYAKAHSKHAETLLDVVSDLYQHQRFDPEEIQREKGVIIEEINMYEDMPQQSVHELLFETLYSNQPAGWSIAGTKETVMSMTRDNFIAYTNAHYVAGATVVVIAGAYDESTVVSSVEKAFVGLRTTPKQDKPAVIDNQKESIVALKHKKSDQTHLDLAMRAYSTYDERNYSLNVLAGILGRGMSSRLFQLLRERMGVCYYVHADVDTYTDHGIFQISAGIDTNRVEETIKALMTELRRLTTELVSETELSKVKEYITGKMALSLESSDSWANYVGMQEVLKKNIKTPSELALRIQAVTANDVMDRAKELIREDNMTLAMVSPYSDKEALKKLLKL